MSEGQIGTFAGLPVVYSANVPPGRVYLMNNQAILYRPLKPKWWKVWKLRSYRKELQRCKNQLARLNKEGAEQ